MIMESSLVQRDRWEEIQAGEKMKFEFVENLLEQLEIAEQKLADSEDRREKIEEAWDGLYMKNKSLKDDLKSERSKLDGNNFVSVLIDGDCMNFLDDLVESKDKGGQEAAQRLLECSRQYLQSEPFDLARDIRVLITVCCNLKGMSKTYVDQNILDKGDDFPHFVRGFNMGNPLCLMVDAGAGKECSDDKLREIFKLHIGQLQCKHIIFGGSADNGYARLFSQYTADRKVRDRVTLLEGPPFAAELAALKGDFHHTRFPSVFRNAKLPTRRVSFSITTSPASTSPGPQTYASTVSTPMVVPAASTTSTINQSMQQQLTGTTNQQATTTLAPQINRNARGFRIDPYIPKPPNSKFEEMKNQKICNNYVFRGICLNEFCPHEHVKVTDDEQMAARRILARSQPCDNAPLCEIVDCFYGHHCSRGPLCNRERCRFTENLHYVDPRNNGV